MSSEKILIIIRLVDSNNTENFQDFPIEQKLFNSIKYLVQHQILSQSISGPKKANAPVEIMSVGTTIVSILAMKTIIKILRELDYYIPQPFKVKSNNIKDWISPKLDEILKDFDHSQLVEIYKAAHFFSLKNLRLTIGAIFACMIYVGPNIKWYEERKQALGVQKEFTYEESLALNQGETESMVLSMNFR